MVADVAFGHDKADVPDVLEVFGRKALGPVERDVAALDHHVLPVLDGDLDHLAQDRPQVRREQVVVLGRQVGAAAADQPHFQVVDRKIRVFVFFEQALRKRGFAGVRSAAEQQDHGGPSFSVGFLHYSGAQGEKQARRNGFGALKEIFYTLFNLCPQVEDAAERAVRAQMARARDRPVFRAGICEFS